MRSAWLIRNAVNKRNRMKIQETAELVTCLGAMDLAAIAAPFAAAGIKPEPALDQALSLYILSKEFLTKKRLELSRDKAVEALKEIGIQ